MRKEEIKAKKEAYVAEQQLYGKHTAKKQALQGILRTDSDH